MMFYHPYAYSIGVRDVIAACLVCLAVAVMGAAYSAARADRHGEALSAVAAPNGLAGKASVEASCG